MTLGGGNLWISQNLLQPLPAPPPPFVSGAAENGLSVDPVSGRIVLGQTFAQAGDPAVLLSDREIPMNDFIFQFINNGSLQFHIDPLNGYYLLGNNSAGNTSKLEIDDTQRSLFFTVNGATHLMADVQSDSYQFGDVSQVFNGYYLGVRDALSEWFIGQRNSVTNTLLHNLPAGIALAYFDSLGNNPFLIPDPSVGGTTFLTSDDFIVALALDDAANGAQARLGDISGAGNGTTFVISDPGQQARITATNGLLITGDTVLLHTGTPWANGAGAAAGTLNNAPAAGNPTKWIPVDDAGVTRYIPAW